MNPLSIGIAGYMGSGKTTCCRLLAAAGDFRIFDGDLEAKKIMDGNQSIKEKLAAEFGVDVIEGNAISYKKLGVAVFGDIEKLRRLNAIVHPLLLERLHYTIFKKRTGVLVIDAALLPLWNIDEWFDLRIWVYASFATRFARLLRKTQAPDKEEILRRMRTQEALLNAPSAASWEYVPNEEAPERMHASVVSYMNGLIARGSK